MKDQVYIVQFGYWEEVYPPCFVTRSEEKAKNYVQSSLKERGYLTGHLDFLKEFDKWNQSREPLDFGCGDGRWVSVYKQNIEGD